MKTQLQQTCFSHKELTSSNVMLTPETMTDNNKKFNILVVDDVPDNIRFLSKFLTEQGYNVRKAINGEMAIKSVSSLLPDLILLDINMPDMSGYDVCKYLKDNPSTCSVPIIFLSAGQEILDKVKAFEVGCVDYITKPFQLEEVIIRIQTHLTIRELQQKQEEQNLQLQQALIELKKAQANLVQQEKMSTLKKVVAGVAHEVNNPLSFIFSNTEPAWNYIQDLLMLIKLYQHDYSDASPAIKNFLNEIDLEFVASDLHHLIQSINNGAERISSVMMALRSFTHLGESGAKPINIHEAIETTLILLQYRLVSRTDGVFIQVYKDYGILPLVTSYAEQLNQVIFNLLLNAIDAIEVKIKKYGSQFSNPQILMQTQLIDGEMVVMRIKDNGIGISEAHQTRIFEPFFTTKPAGQGLGLGLVTSRRIIEEMHNGSLTYSSSFAEGSEFVIQIPL